MALVIASWLLGSLLLLTSMLYVLHLYISRTANYFKDRGIPYIRPTPFVGLPNYFNSSSIEIIQFLYNSFPGERFFGYFQAHVPTFFVKDPHLVHCVMVRDFAYFYDRGFPFVENDLLSQNLMNLKGQTWKFLRQKLVPTLSTGKIKLMFDQLIVCVDGLCEEIEKDVISGEAVDMRVSLTKFSTELIANTAFGLDLRQGSPQGLEFFNKVQDLFTITTRMVMFRFFLLFCPKVLSALKIGAFPHSATEYFLNLTKNTKEYRKKNNIKRNDYFQVLLSLQEAEESGKSLVADNMSEEDALINQMASLSEDILPEKTIHKKVFKDEDITAHSFVFLAAGLESVTGAVSFLLYHVAKDVEIERRVITEIREALAQHGWTYNAFREMPYLDQVIQETLRMYPLGPLLMRQCTRPYTIPDSNVVVERGTIVVIPVGGLQMDSRYYPSPNTFNPDRFAGNNYKPSPTYLPFGDGPRSCMAMRFAILEIKVCVSKILSKYTVHVSNKTKEPFTFDRSLFPRPVGGIWLNLKKRTQEID